MGRSHSESHFGFAFTAGALVRLQAWDGDPLNPARLSQPNGKLDFGPVG